MESSLPSSTSSRGSSPLFHSTFNFSPSSKPITQSPKLRLSLLGYLSFFLSILFLISGFSFNVSLLVLLGLALEIFVIRLAWAALSLDNHPLTCFIELSSSTVQANRFVTLRVTIHNESSNDFTAILNLNLPPGIFLISDLRLLYFRISAKGALTRTLILHPVLRGKYDLSNLELVHPGFMGMYEIYVSFPSLSLSVLPPYHFGILTKKRGQELISLIVGRFAVKFKGIGDEVHSLREYVTGDPLKIIHWKASARHSTLISKDFEMENVLSISILLNASGTMTGSKFDKAIQVVQELSDLFSNSEISFSLSIFADKVLFHLPYGKGKRQFALVQRLLFDLYPTNTKPNLQAVIDFLLERRVNRNLIFIISDIEQNPFTVAKQIRRLKFAENHVLYLNISTHRFNLPSSLSRLPSHLFLSSSSSSSSLSSSVSSLLSFSSSFPSTKLGEWQTDPSFELLVPADDTIHLSKDEMINVLVKGHIEHEYAYREYLLGQELSRLGMHLLSFQGPKDSIISLLSKFLKKVI